MSHASMYALQWRYTLFTESQASMLTNHAPYSPVYKLSVLTPEEERAATTWQGVWWAAAIGVLAAGVWWWWRRRASAE